MNGAGLHSQPALYSLPAEAGILCCPSTRCFPCSASGAYLMDPTLKLGSDQRPGQFEPNCWPAEGSSLPV